MAQAHVMSGLRIETVSPTGQLSLHSYRKFLSQEDDIKMSFSPPSRTLKRKQAAVNLFQAQSYDYAYSLQSPVSSAPSSPPPLSFSQSVISLPGDISTPISPASTSRLFSQPSSSVQSLVTRKMDPFSARLKKQKQPFQSHSRSSSHLTSPSTGGYPKVNHNGAQFEILNPSDSISRFLSAPSYRFSIYSEDTMERESPEHSPTRSLMASPIPDDMVRPISASESAVLSKFSSPPQTPGLQHDQASFAALPRLEESPPLSARAQSPRIPAKTLRQKVSRLFGRGESDHGKNHEKGSDLHGASTPSEPMTPVHKTEHEETSYVEVQDHTQQEVDETKALRRRTHGPHSSNRHHTMQDVLRQLESENNGLTFEDIMQYIGSGRDQRQESSNNEEREEGIERPWQPDTWAEVPRVPAPRNRPSDSNLSTNAPSTRASIRPYVQRAAAFMAGGENRASISSSESTVAEEEEEGREEDNEEKESEEEDTEHGSDGSWTNTETEFVYEIVPITPVRRTISRRARPLSSNPPDLDIPIISSSPSSVAVSPIPASPTSLRARTISWSPEIPARHPDHRIVRFPDAPPRIGSPPPPQVVTTVIPRKPQKKYASACPCL